MTDSPSTPNEPETLEPKEAPNEGTPNEPKGSEKMVPVQAVAKERSEKRAARSEVERLKQELAEASKQSFTPEDISKLMDEMIETAKSAVEEQIAPLRQENELLQTAVELGLSGEQAKRVIEIRSKNPNLTGTQALVLAKVEEPELFSSSAGSVPPSMFGGVPAAGASQARTQKPEDFVAKMNEARSKGDVQGTMRFAKAEFLRRISGRFLKERPQYRTQ